MPSAVARKPPVHCFMVILVCKGQVLVGHVSVGHVWAFAYRRPQ